MDNMPFDPDFENNPDWSHFPANAFRRIDKGIQAHSAPLGLSFLQGSKVSLPFRNAAVTALHGSWNRSRKTGYDLQALVWLSLAWKSHEPKRSRDFQANSCPSNPNVESAMQKC
jgi:hypothetical protein